jgi:hypothetical protein
MSLNNIQDIIENRDESGLSTSPVPVVPTASLLVDNALDGDSLFSIPPFGEMTSIRHNDISFVTANEVEISQNSSLKIDSFEIGHITAISPREVGFSQNNVFKGGFAQDGSLKICTSQINMDHKCSRQVGILQVSSSQADTRNIGIFDIGTAKISSRKIDVSPIDVLQIGIAQNTSTKNNPIQSEITQVNSTEINASEISNSSSIGISKFRSIHEFISPFITNIYSTAQSIWQTNTTIDLNFAITNLPTGQLAEATITGYDTSGRPNTATITLDDDGNGLGWFIDTTPQDNREFLTGVGGNYFTANPDSQADGKYDLLTTILHELGHLNG